MKGLSARNAEKRIKAVTNNNSGLFLCIFISVLILWLLVLIQHLFIRIPITAFLKYILRSILHCFFISQLFSPLHTSGSIRTFTRIFKLCIAGSLFIFRILPVVPALRTDMSAKLTINKSRSGIIPGAAVSLQFLKTYPNSTPFGVEAAVMYESRLLCSSQYSKRAVEGPKIKSVVPSI